jgi:hypothetical protein
MLAEFTGNPFLSSLSKKSLKFMRLFPPRYNLLSLQSVYSGEPAALVVQHKE